MKTQPTKDKPAAHHEGRTTGDAKILKSDGVNFSPLKRKVSVCRINKGPTTIEGDAEAADILQGIKRGVWKGDVQAYRKAVAECGGKDDPRARAEKMKLPAITFSGRIEGEQARAMEESRLQHSGLIQLDFDKLPNPEKTRDTLARDPHVAAVWISPSLDGVKGLGIIPQCFSQEEHKTAFKAAQKHYSSKYGLEMDAGPSNAQSLCFVSWDEDLKLNPSATPIEVLATSTTTGGGVDYHGEFPGIPREGINGSLCPAARWCLVNGLSRDEAVAKIMSYEATNRRPYQPGEVERAVGKVYEAEIIPDDVFPVPAGGISMNEAAGSIFGVMGEARKMFMRGTMPVEVARMDDADQLRPVSPERFCALVEKVGKRVARRETLKGDDGEKRTVWRSSTFPISSAKILLETDAAREQLPPIRQLVSCPILSPDGEILGKGYHDHAGGTYVTEGGQIEEVMHGTAFQALLGLLSDFDFPTPSDRSRAFAMMISPALKMGGWIEDDFPLDMAEADQSQSGKTFRQKLICRIYNETPTSITVSKGGVGSIDEKISQALVMGRPFITMGNVRGKIDSQILEEALRGAGRVTCRTLRKSAEVDCSPFMWQLSTNGAEMTRDLANRTIVTRIKKRGDDYEWKEFPEGDIESHVVRNQSYYLSCVFSIIEEWRRRGRPRTKENRHDFRGWCRALDGIIEMVKLPPLLDGHREQQQRTANPNLQWLREIILATRQEDYGRELYTHDIVNIAEENGIEFPGNPFSKLDPCVRAGRIVGKLYRDADADQIEVDGHLLKRIEAPDYSAEGAGREVRRYIITKL